MTDNNQPLDPQTAADKLNAISQDKDLGLTFEVAKDGSVQAKVDKEVAPKLKDPVVGTLTGSNKFHEVDSDTAGSKAWGAIKARAGANSSTDVGKQHVLKAKDLTKADIDAFEHNATALKPALEGDLSAANTEHARIVAADQAAQMTPEQKAAANSLKTGALTYDMENGKLTAHLDKEHAGNLQNVLSSGVTPEQLFGSNKFQWDKDKGTLTVNGELTPEEKKAYADRSAIIDSAIKTGDGAYVKDKLKAFEADPKQVALAESLNKSLKDSQAPITFHADAQGKTVVADLTPEQAAHLAALKKGGMADEKIFGSKDFTLGKDSNGKDAIVMAQNPTDDKAVEHFNTYASVVTAAVSSGVAKIVDATREATVPKAPAAPAHPAHKTPAKPHAENVNPSELQTPMAVAVAQAKATRSITG